MLFRLHTILFDIQKNFSLSKSYINFRLSLVIKINSEWLLWIMPFIDCVRDLAAQTDDFFNRTSYSKYLSVLDVRLALKLPTDKSVQLSSFIAYIFLQTTLDRKTLTD